MQSKALATLALLAISVAASQAADGTFNVDNEGSKQGRVGQLESSGYETWTYPSPPADHSVNGGVGDSGYIYQDIDGDLRNRGYGLYPGQAYTYLGDLSGKTVTMSVLVSGDVLRNLSLYSDGRSRVMARPYIDINPGGDYSKYSSFLAKSSASLDLNSIRGMGWVSFSIEMKEDNFLRWPNSQTGASLYGFNDILSGSYGFGLAILSGSDDYAYDFGMNPSNTAFDSLKRLHEFGAYSDGTTRFGIDNLEAVPEPFTMTLGASALALAIARRRRAKS